MANSENPDLNLDAIEWSGSALFALNTRMPVQNQDRDAPSNKK